MKLEILFLMDGVDYSVFSNDERAFSWAKHGNFC